MFAFGTLREIIFRHKHRVMECAGLVRGTRIAGENRAAVDGMHAIILHERVSSTACLRFLARNTRIKDKLLRTLTRSNGFRWHSSERSFHLYLIFRSRFRGAGVVEVHRIYAAYRKQNGVPECQCWESINSNS